MRPRNSLITDWNSLFGRKNSLFYCVGNLMKKRSNCSGLRGSDMAKNADSGENSLLIPCITGNLGGDGFAADCLLYQRYFRPGLGRKAGVFVDQG